jgi:cytoskeletal protein RodZ
MYRESAVACVSCSRALIPAEIDWSERGPLCAGCAFDAEIAAHRGAVTPPRRSLRSHVIRVLVTVVLLFVVGLIGLMVWFAATWHYW